VIANELDLVLGNAEPPVNLPAIGLASFTVHCAGNATTVLECARITFAAVLRHSDHNFDELIFWQSVLPPAFVKNCAPEISAAEAEIRRRLPLEQRINCPWSLLNWLFWFKPSERQWYWWSSQCHDASIIIIHVQPVDQPFAHGALDWLFLASGAESVESKN
jgi:hypothetical protein